MLRHTSSLMLQLWLMTTSIYALEKKIEPVQNTPIEISTDASKNKMEDISVIPPRVFLYPFFNTDIEHFTVLIRNATPIDKTHIRISILDETRENVQFYTNNIQWKKIENYYYLTSIYGKPADIPIVETFFKLDISYRFKPDKHTRAQLDIVSGDIVLKTIPIDFITPFQMEYYIDNAIALINRGNKEKAAAVIIVAVLLLFFLDLFVLRRRRKKVPLCSTRARFSTLVEDNKTIYIEETRNPFGCRLGGLKKKVKISYKNSNIYVKISGKKNIYPDKDTVSLDINEFWKLRIEAQNYFGNDEKSHKNLVILLLPN